MQSDELICTNGNRNKLDHPNIDSCCANALTGGFEEGKRKEAEDEETEVVASVCTKNFQWDLFRYDMDNT